MIQFSSKKTTSPINPSNNSKRLLTIDTFCICKKPEKGRYIKCDSCNEWYHPECINMSESKFDDLSKQEMPFFCKECKKT